MTRRTKKKISELEGKLEKLSNVVGLMSLKEAVYNAPLTVKIKYFDKEITKLEKVEKGDWIDLRSAETVKLKKGETRLIKLGVGMILPKGYEANVVARSSTLKNWGVIQGNCYGVIDNSFNGDGDEWLMPVYAIKDTVINKNDRVCQFRLNKIQPKIHFEEVQKLKDKDRGSFGSTGTK